MDKSIIIAIITSIFGSGILSTVISHILYSRKLKKEQGMKSEFGVGVNTARALHELKNVLKCLDSIEIYNAEEAMQDKTFSALEGNIIYPEIMNDKQSLNMAYSKIRDFRMTYEDYLDRKTAQRVILIDRYLMQLMIFLKGFEEKYWPMLGTIFIIDIQKILQSCDRCVTSRINHQKYRMDIQHGRRWNWSRKIQLEKPFNKTLLMRMKNGKTDELEKRAISEVMVTILKEA